MRELIDSLGDEAYEVIDTFLNETPTQLQELRFAAAQGDWPEAQRLAHSIKSSAGIFGAGELAQCSKVVEEIAGQESPAIAETMQRLDGAFERVRNYLMEFRRNEEN